MEALAGADEELEAEALGELVTAAALPLGDPVAAPEVLPRALVCGEIVEECEAVLNALPLDEAVTMPDVELNALA